jgi:predicted peptidase
MLPLLLSLCSILYGQDYSAYEKKIFVHEGDTLLYRIMWPEDMRNDKKYPLILFLHGMGERGSDNQLQLKLGGELFMDSLIRKQYPAVVLFPQCPPDVMWTHRDKVWTDDMGWVLTYPVEAGPTKPAGLVNMLVDELSGGGKIDTTRRYIMGLSMGGQGTLEFLYFWPGKYVAAEVICGGHNPELTGAYCHTPVWFFHGGKDDVVPPRYSRAVYKKLKKCNRKTRYTLFPDANHNSWDATFAEPGLLKWLFQFRQGD